MLKRSSKTLYVAFQQHKNGAARMASMARASSTTRYLHQSFCRNASSIFHNNGVKNSNCYGQMKVGCLQIRAMSDETLGFISEESVKKTISENPLVVYSKTSCPFSSEVKSLFRRLGADAHVVELDKLGPEGPQLQKVLEQLTGQRTVPNVFIGGKHIGGCSDTLELHQKGELEPLLSEADAT